jgi:dTDP-4-amino-4,6-dideoxygalactose transaminase
VSEWRIALSALNYGPEEEAALLRVLRGGWISMGPEVQAFEAEFAELQGGGHAFAVANGTGGLHLALAALDLKPGDEVIQPALNFVASANMTAALGATPVFADVIGLEEPTIDPAGIEKLITPSTRALIVMHYGGYLCRMPEIAATCRERGIRLVEDACHAVGAAERDGAMAGAIGDIGVFSFFSNKNIATGEGGMVFTRDEALAERVRLLRSHGMTTLTWDRHKGHANAYDVKANGFNYRMDDLHAALGREQLKKLADGNRRRAELSERYRRRLAQSPDWIVPFAAGDRPSAHHLMAVVAPDAETRRRAVDGLRAGGIQSSFH